MKSKEMHNDQLGTESMKKLSVHLQSLIFKWIDCSTTY